MTNRTISFHRKYYSYTGGHQKVKDYIEHFKAANFRPILYTEGSPPTHSKLFSDLSDVTYQTSYNPAEASIAFLAGMDWKPYLESDASHTTTFNLIQHVRHSDKNSPLFQYLSQPAIRLCVSDAVKNAIEPYANGPCHTINMGIALPAIKQKRNNDLYILASKQPDLGKTIFEWAIAKGFTAILHDKKETRTSVLNEMASAHTTLALPNETEGFFLPSIEAMFYSNSAVVPYCVANSEYHNVASNLIIPKYNISSIQQAVLTSLHQNKVITTIRKRIGYQIVKRYTLTSEREALKKVISMYL